MNEQIDDEQSPQRPRWLGWAIVVLMTMVVLGVLNVGWLIMRPAPVAAADPAAADPVLQQGRTAVLASDCMRCHMVERKAVGPGFAEIAERYAGDAEAPARMADKIRNGSVGTWGRVIMPRHPQVSEADAARMAGWILAQRQTAPEAAAPATR